MWKIVIVTPTVKLGSTLTDLKEGSFKQKCVLVTADFLFCLVWLLQTKKLKYWKFNKFPQNTHKNPPQEHARNLHLAEAEMITPLPLVHFKQRRLLWSSDPIFFLSYNLCSQLYTRQEEICPFWLLKFNLNRAQVCTQLIYDAALGGPKGQNKMYFNQTVWKISNLNKSLRVRWCWILLRLWVLLIVICYTVA